MKFIIIKKAAMFGLDARIALAIFGALSVISGAALYSAIQEAKTIQYVQYFENLAKAYQAMYLDTAQHDVETNKAGCYLVINNPPRNGWKGPYYNIDNAKTDCTLANEKFNLKDPIILKYSLNNTPTHTILFDDYKNSSGWGGTCTQSDCAIYTFSFLSNVSRKDGVTDETILTDLKKIDEKIDNGDGGDSGNFRYNSSGIFWGYKVMNK
jgi:type II secretory pathway pseudopilin PulG